MRVLAIFSCLFFTLIACQKRSDKALRQKQAGRFISQKQEKDTLSYRLQQIYDPYLSVPRKAETEEKPKYLILHTSGTFLEYDAFNQNQGRWYVNKTKERLKLVYEVENGIEIPPTSQDSSFRYQLVKLSQDSLVIGKQGRHGIVQYTYLLQPDSIMQEAMLPSQPETDSVIADTVKLDSIPKIRKAPSNPMVSAESLSQDAANQLLFDSLVYDTCSWRLFSIADPFQEMLPESDRNDTSSIFTNNPTFLRFLKSGKFIRFDQNGYGEGQWNVSSENEDRLRFQFTQQNGQEISPINQDQYYRHILQKRTSDTLVIGIQGRHGIVRYTYLHCPNDSVPPYPAE